MNSISTNALGGLTSLSGNLAIDLAVLILALVIIGRFVRGSHYYLYNAQKKKTKLLTLRKTLELRSVEVATLRATLMQLREETVNDCDEKPPRGTSSKVTDTENLCSEEPQLKAGSPAASRNRFNRYDA